MSNLYSETDCQLLQTFLVPSRTKVLELSVPNQSYFDSYHVIN